MTGAPVLTETEVRAEVERVFQRTHRAFLVALHGSGSSGRFELDGRGWEIVPTRCELELREQLPRPGEASEGGRVYLVDWASDSLPLDIGCRLAGGRVYHLARDARLAALFGAREVEAGLAGTAVARFLVSGALPGVRRVSGLVLTRDELWRRYLEARFAMPEAATGSVPALLGWCRRAEGGVAHARAAERDEGLSAVGRELRSWLSDTLGPMAILVWSAWEAGLVSRLLEVLVLLDAGEATTDPFLRGVLGGQLSAWLPGLGALARGSEVPPAASELLAATLTDLGDTDRAVVLGAERLAVEAGLARLAAASLWLPAGHSARELHLAERLANFVVSPSRDALAEVLAADDALRAHRLDAVLWGTDDAEARRMVVRVATWLLTRRTEPPVAAFGTAWQPAVDLARRYAEDGGYLDWARQAARGLRRGSPPLEVAVKRLLSVVDEEIRDDDRRFAEAYVSWLEAGKPSAEVVPVEHVTRRFVAPFLRGNRRKLLLVLMDGMSQATAVQLLHRLRDQRRWGPIAWRAEGWRGRLPLPPVLAVAPTLTEVSRSALFAGAADPRFGNEATDRDEARWSTNPVVREILGEAAGRVFFRRDIHAGHALRDEVRGALEGDERVVAVIVNAIDEQLRGSLQVGVDYSRQPILALEALLSLLSAAEGAERAVLLVADHGHVAGDALRVVGGRLDAGRPGGARWRALAAGEQPGTDEVRLPRSCWKPAGWDSVAVLWDHGVSHRAAHHGEHGGLSLAEAVAPAVLVGPEWLDRIAGDDPELSARPLPTPEWWEPRLPRAVLPPPAAAPSTPAPIEQLSLLPPVAVVAAPAPTEDDLVRRLRGARAFRDRVRDVSESELERVLLWLSALASGQDAMPAADFAKACGVRPHQVGGVVARMGILNADGFPMVEHDAVGRRVVLHRARLVQQFAVPS